MSYLALMECFTVVYARTWHLKGAVPVLDAFLEGPLERTEGHRLRHRDVLVEEGHVVVNAFQDACSCWTARQICYTHRDMHARCLICMFLLLDLD